MKACLRLRTSSSLYAALSIVMRFSVTICCMRSIILYVMVCLNRPVTRVSVFFSGITAARDLRTKSFARFVSLGTAAACSALWYATRDHAHVHCVIRLVAIRSCRNPYVQYCSSNCVGYFWLVRSIAFIWFYQSLVCLILPWFTQVYIMLFTMLRIHEHMRRSIGSSWCFLFWGVFFANIALHSLDASVENVLSVAYITFCTWSQT